MILGVIVTFNPNLQDLERNILSVIKQLDKLVVFDNNSSNQDLLINLVSKFNIEVINNNTNIGLGAAYNFVFKKHFVGFDYFVTLDQDTLLPNNLMPQLLKLFNVSDRVGIVGPSFMKSNFKIDREFYFVDSLIQSCSVFSKTVFNNVGYFNEKLFIDSVDFEYCLRVKMAGYNIIRSNRDFILHELGVTRSRFGVSYTEHSALRNYYIARNHKYLTERYFKIFPFFIIKKNIFFFIHILKLIFLDQDLNKINHIIKGFKDNLN